MADTEKTYVPLEEYFNSDIDFGFTAVDAEEVEGDDSPSPPSTQEVVSEVSSEILSSLNDSIETIEGKLNALLLRNDEVESGVDASIDFSRVEEKIDKILAMENQELLSAVTEQGESIRAIIDEVEERKSELENQTQEKLSQIERLVLPLLYNLIKSSDKDYIFWPDRKSRIESQISQILTITRG